MHKRILITGTRSGCGKTTVVSALLSVFRARGLPLSSFKCGPDYIDPLFHREILGIPGYNLDPFFCNRQVLRGLLAEKARELSVIEGAMGFYDGIGADGQASAYDVARATETPVILVIDASGLYTSAGAIIRGFLAFRPENRIRGVIFNGAHPSSAKGLDQVAREAGVEPLGFLPRDARLTIPGRHLGLMTSDELTDLRTTLCALEELANAHIDIDGVLRIASSAPEIRRMEKQARPMADVRIAVARDRAFFFLYEENLNILESLGGQLCFFSPLDDQSLPENIGGLYLPGGYPELYAQALSANSAMRAAISAAIADGLPTIAEGGGFLYLHESLEGFPMAGAIAGAAWKSDRLQRFGYMTLTAEKDNLLCERGGILRAQEFHYCQSGNGGEDFSLRKASNGQVFRSCHAAESLYAGFPHFYFPSDEEPARRFIKKAVQYQQLHR